MIRPTDLTSMFQEIKSERSKLYDSTAKFKLLGTQINDSVSSQYNFKEKENIETQCVKFIWFLNIFRR